jgi:hypothetical protein
VFQIKDLLKPNSKISVGAVATPFSSSKDRPNLQNCLLPHIPTSNHPLGKNFENLPKKFPLTDRNYRPADAHAHPSKQSKKLEMIHIEMKESHFYVYREFLTDTKLN